MTALDDCGFADNRVVHSLFGHGDMIGAPGIAMHPEYGPNRISAPANLVDIVPTLPDNVPASRRARKIADFALATGRSETRDFTPRPLNTTTRYMRRGNAFPTVDRRGYLPVKKRTNP